MVSGYLTVNFGFVAIYGLAVNMYTLVAVIYPFGLYFPVFDVCLLGCLLTPVMDVYIYVLRCINASLDNVPHMLFL